MHYQIYQIRIDVVAGSIMTNQPVDVFVSGSPVSGCADDSSISGSRTRINGCLQRCVGGLDLSLETVDLCPGLGDSLVALFHLDSRDQSFAKKIFESGIALSQRLQLFRIRRGHRLQARLVLFRRIDEVLPEPLTVSRASSFSGLLE